MEIMFERKETKKHTAIFTSTRNNDSQTGMSITRDVSNSKALIQQLSKGDAQNEAERKKIMHGKVNYEKLIRCLTRSVAYKVSCGTVLLCLKPGKIISEAENFSFNIEWF